MKKYKKYMDGVKVPDTLHQRLVELETPGKRSIPWKRYGSMAAALVLVCGVGAWGLNESGAWGQMAAQLRSGFNPLMETEAADLEGQPDIALAIPGELNEPAEKTLGGYDVTVVSGSEAMVSHYVLPYIEYGEPDGTEAANQVAADWGIPVGASRRDLTQEEIVALMGGETAVNTHLNWGEYELTGWAAWYEDGTFWGAYIDGILRTIGTWVPMNSFEFAVTAGQLPPTCFGYPYSVTQEIRGLTVTADKYCTSPAISAPYDASIPDVTHLTVRFMKDDYGYSFEMGSADPELAEVMVSRLVCQVADRGLALWNVDPSVETYTCSICGQTIPVGEEHYHTQPYIGVNENGMTSIEPYAPEESGEICGLPPADDSIWKDTGSIVPAQYQSVPPTLRVLSSEGMADGRSGNYEWTYTETGSGASTSVVACGVHPLDFQDAPGLTTEDGTVTLNFFDLPDQVSAVCWPDSEWGNTSAASQTAQVSRNGQTCVLTLKDGGWIYEISAGWDGQGTASYVFYLVKN